MNIKWSRLLKTLRDLKVPFTTTIEGENIEVVVIRGEYMESNRWNRLHILDQLAFLKKIGVNYGNSRISRWKSHQDFKKQGRRA